MVQAKPENNKSTYQIPNTKQDYQPTSKEYKPTIQKQRKHFVNQSSTNKQTTSPTTQCLMNEQRKLAHQPAATLSTPSLAHHRYTQYRKRCAAPESWQAQQSHIQSHTHIQADAINAFSSKP